MSNTLSTRKIVRFVIKVVCILLIVAALTMIGVDKYKEHTRKEQDKNLQDLYYGLILPSAAAEESEEQPELEPEQPQLEPEQAVEPSDEGSEEGELVFQEDFADLYAINDDLVGWLEVGEDIALPIVYLDNEYYLEHDFYGEWDDAGTVFINEANSIWPADQNLLFHGHNMRSGAVFGNFDEFRKVEYLKEYPLISWRTIYDEEPTYYVPIALFDASMYSDNPHYFNIGKIRFDTDEKFMEFANSAIDWSYFELPIDVQPDDMLITLITCSYEYDNSRFIIIARALREDETVESVTELMQQAVAK